MKKYLRVVIAVMAVFMMSSSAFGIVYGKSGYESYGYSESTAWEINSASVLAKVRDDYNSSNSWIIGGYFKLTKDIDLTSYTDWEPIGSKIRFNDSPSFFNGHFDGGGHTIKVNISKVQISEPEWWESYCALFGVVTDGSTIKNLNVEGSVAYAGRAHTQRILVGGIAAYLCGGTIENCKFDGTITANQMHDDYPKICAGGIVGYAGGYGGFYASRASDYYAIIKNCEVGSKSETTITARASTANALYAGGLTAFFDDDNRSILSGNWIKATMDAGAKGSTGALFAGRSGFQGKLSNNTEVDPNEEPEASGLAVDSENFPDDVFRSYVSSNFDTDNDGALSDEEIAGIVDIDVADSGISSLQGIEYFTSLRDIECSRNNITALDLSKNVLLEGLNSWNNCLTTLDVSHNPALKVIGLSNLLVFDEKSGTEHFSTEYSQNNLTALDVSKNPELEVLLLDGSSLKKLDVSHNPKLRMLHFINNKITAIDVSACTQLESLLTCQNNITALDVSKNTALISLDIAECPITALDVRNNKQLKFLCCNETRITTIDLSNNTLLRQLQFWNSSLETLDVSACTKLEELGCGNSLLTTLDVSKNVALRELICSQNRLTSLKFGKNTKLQVMNCKDNQLTVIDLSGCNSSFVPNFEVDEGVQIIYSNTTLTISPETLSSGKAGTDYSATLSANLSGVTWSATDLPSWLSLNASTGELSGKPTTGGSYTFTVTASLSSLSVQKIYTLTISSGSGGGDTGTEEDPVIVDPPRFDSANLTLTGQIAVNFYMELPENPGVDYDDGNTCYTEFDINGDTSGNNPQTVDRKFTDSDGYYGFKCYVTSIQMADPITATFYYGGESVQQSYSVKRYLDNMINRSTTSTAMKNLAVAIKNYGHYAQIYLDRVNDSWELGTDHVALEAASDYITEDIASVKSAVASYKIASESYSGTGIKSPSYSLNLDSETTINLTFTMYDNFTGELHAYLNGGTTDLAVKQTDGTYRVRITNIAAHELADTQTVKICVGKDNNYAGKEFTIKSSGLTFVYNSLYGSYPEDRQQAAVAFYKYYESTVAYRNTK